MPTRKKATTKDKPQSTIQVLKEATCPTSSGKSKLGYQIGIDDSGEIFLTVVSNTGGGFFSAGEWISFSDIQAAIEAWPADAPITSMAFARLYRGKSANNPGFLTAVLVAEGLLEPLGDRKRVHSACDPTAFLEQIEELKAGSANPAPKAKTRAKGKSTARSTAKAPRKTTTRRKKSS
jgi:hypothetical protein